MRSTLEETTVQITPTTSIDQGIFKKHFFVCRSYEIFQRSTIALGIISILLLLCCMMACFCCIKKRGEVYLLRNAEGIDNNARNSNENVSQLDVEIAERNAETEREMFNELENWAASVHQPQLRNRNLSSSNMTNTFNMESESDSVM